MTSNIYINGFKVESFSKQTSMINSLESDFSNIQKYYDSVLSDIESEKKSTELFENLAINMWDSIIAFFKSVVEFIVNIFRSKIYSLKATKLIKELNKIKHDEARLNSLNWNAPISAPNSINVTVEEMEILLNEIDDEQSKIVTSNVKKDKVSTEVIKGLKELRDKSDGEENIPIITALEILSKRDIGCPKISGESSIDRLESTIKYLMVYANNSSNRLKNLIKMKNRCNRKLQKAIRKRESKLDDEYNIESYRVSVKINDLCLKISIKNINFVFTTVTKLIKDSMKQ